MRLQPEHPAQGCRLDGFQNPFICPKGIIQKETAPCFERALELKFSPRASPARINCSSHELFLLY